MQGRVVFSIFQRELDSVDLLILPFQLPEVWDNKTINFHCLKPLGRWYSITAVLGNQYRWWVYISLARNASCSPKVLCLHSHQQRMGILVVLHCVGTWSWHFYFNHSNRCAVIAHCGLNFYIPDGLWCQTSFRVLACHPHIYFSGAPVQIFCPIFIGCVFP